MTRPTDRMQQNRKEPVPGRWQATSRPQLTESSSWSVQGGYPQSRVHMGLHNQEDVPFKRPRLTLSEQLDIMKQEGRTTSKNWEQKLQPHRPMIALPGGSHQLNQSLIKMTAACGQYKRYIFSSEGEERRKQITSEPKMTQLMNRESGKTGCGPNCNYHCRYCTKCFGTQYLANFHAQSHDHKSHVSQWVYENHGHFSPVTNPTMFDLVLNEMCTKKGNFDTQSEDSLALSQQVESVGITKLKNLKKEEFDVRSQSTTADIRSVMGQMAFVDNTDTLSQSTTAEIRSVLGEMAFVDNTDTLSQSTTAEIRSVLGEIALDNSDTLSQSTTADIRSVLGEMALDNSDTLSQSTTAEVRQVMREIALDNSDTLSQSTTAEIRSVLGEMALDNSDTLSQSTTAEVRQVLREMALDNSDTLSQSTTAEVRQVMREMALDNSDTLSQSTTAAVRPVLESLNLTLEESFDAESQDFDTCSVSTITELDHDSLNSLNSLAHEVFSQIMDKKDGTLFSVSANPMIAQAVKVENENAVGICGAKHVDDDESAVGGPHDVIATTVNKGDGEFLEIFGKCPQELGRCAFHCFPCDEHHTIVDKRQHLNSRRHVANVSGFSKSQLSDPDRYAVRKWVTVSLDDHAAVLGEESRRKLWGSGTPKGLLEKLRTLRPHLRDIEVRYTSKLVKNKTDSGFHVVRRGIVMQYRHAGQVAWKAVPPVLLAKVKRAIKEKKRRPARRVKEKANRKQMKQSSKALVKMAKGAGSDVQALPTPTVGNDSLSVPSWVGNTSECWILDPCVRLVPSGDSHLPKTTTQPQDYQLEMYNAAMLDDSVCVLPKGSREVLVPAMVIDKMLQLNPSRPVLVLVEKLSEVLLWSASLRAQIGQDVFIRNDRESTGSLKMERKARIGCFSEGFVATQGHSLASLDIIVVTVDYFGHVLDKQWLKWSDACLVVFPDARLALSCDEFPELPSRPKILGFLTPTMHDPKVSDVEKTLTGVLKKIGGAKIYVGDQKKMTDSTQDGFCLLLRHSKLNKAELDFMTEIQLYIAELYKTLTTSDNQALFGLILELGHLDKQDSSDGIGLAAEVFDIGTVERIRGCLHVMISCQDVLKFDEVTINFLRHFNHICSSFLGLLYGSTGIAAYMLNKLNKGLYSFRFTEIGSLAPRSELLTLIEKFNTLELFKSQNCIDELLPNMSAVHRVVKELVDVDWSARLHGKHPIVAVIVQSPIIARIWSHLFERSDFLRLLNLKSASVSGRGRQVVMQRIHQHTVQILVMTPEDIDVTIPELQLVIQVTPPSRVVHLGCRHLILCRNNQEIQVVKTLRKSEKNLLKVAEKLKEL